MTYRELLNKAKQTNKSSEDYTAALQYLLLAYCEEYNIDLYADFDNPASTEFSVLFEKGAKRVLENEPLAYILGYEPFYGRNIKTDKRAFIPRPETEELVNEVLMLLDEQTAGQEILGLDLGTGSGAIAITLSLEKSGLKMWAVDIDEQALSLAQENAELFKTEIEFVHSDLFNNVPQTTKFDFIICNPPYIKQTENLAASVIDYEPHTALFGGEDGLAFYREIFRQTSSYLKTKNFLAFEIGYDQKTALIELAESCFPNSEVLVKQDINAKDRFLFILTNW